jgi:hypothetical protein
MIRGMFLQNVITELANRIDHTTFPSVTWSPSRLMSPRDGHDGNGRIALEGHGFIWNSIGLLTATQSMNQDDQMESGIYRFRVAF